MRTCLACGTGLALGATQCHACLEPVVEINGRALVSAPGTTSPKNRFSRWRRGATNLGWPARGATTLFVGFGALWVFASARAVFANVSNVDFGVWYALAAIPVTVVSLWRIWRPTRIRRDAPTPVPF